MDSTSLMLYSCVDQSVVLNVAYFITIMFFTFTFCLPWTFLFVIFNNLGVLQTLPYNFAHFVDLNLGMMMLLVDKHDNAHKQQNSNWQPHVHCCP